MGLRVSACGLLFSVAVASAACVPASSGSSGRGSTTPARASTSSHSTTTSAPAAATASAGCGCLAIAGEVAASVIADVARADLLYVKGDFQGALDLYAKAYAVSQDAVLLYAQGMVKWHLGLTAEARALLVQYITAGGSFVARADAAIRDIDDGVGAAVGAAVGAGAAAGGAVAGTLGGTVGLVGDVAKKPARVAGTAGVVLIVVGVAALGAVGIHSIAAGLKDDVELDAKFDLGMSVTGVVVGATGFYVYGLTAASATVAAACATRVVSLPEKTPIVAPIAVPGGGGVGAMMSF